MPGKHEFKAPADLAQKAAEAKAAAVVGSAATGRHLECL